MNDEEWKAALRALRGIAINMRRTRLRYELTRRARVDGPWTCANVVEWDRYKLIRLNNIASQKEDVHA